MVAGSGITHSEREEVNPRGEKYSMHGLQMWLALPEAVQETDPEFFHYPKNRIPEYKENRISYKVLIGDAYGVTSPVKTFSPTIFVVVSAKKNDVLKTPTASEVAIIVLDGQARLNNTTIETGEMVVLNKADIIQATKDAKIIFLGGGPLGHRYIEWNFVSSDYARIKQAKDDWFNGKFKKVVGDEVEFIPLP